MYINLTLLGLGVGQNTYWAFCMKIQLKISESVQLIFIELGHPLKLKT